MPAGKKTYHHGNLRAALLTAAESVLEDKGIEGFTLRECARRAGVSHAAPKHHFQDVQDLLTAMAITAFQRLNEAMCSRRAQAENDPRAILQATGEGYIAFAAANPQHFSLMFQKQTLDWSNSELKAVSQTAFMELANAVAAVRGVEDAMSEPDARTDVILMWSVAHGFAQLFLQQQFGPGKFEQGQDRQQHLKALSREMLERLLQLYN